MDHDMTDGSQILVPNDAQALWDRVNADPSVGAEPPADTVHALVARWAAVSPDRAAVITAAGSVTYHRLSELAVALAPRILTATQALVCADLGWEAVAAVLAAATAGVPFDVLDPAAPEWEREEVLRARPSAVVLTTVELQRRLRWPDGTVVVAVDRPDLPAAPSGGARHTEVRGDDPLCLLGPDGVEPLSHRATTDVLTDLVARFDLGPDDRWLALGPVTDPVGLTSVLGALVSGGAVVVPDAFDIHTPTVWFELIRQHAVTVWHATPSLTALLAEHLAGRGEAAPGLRVALVGGEPLAPATVERLRSVVGAHLRVANLLPGGPAGPWAACAEVGDTAGVTGHVTIGTPLAQRRLYVLSETLTPCPVWVTGRVHVGGRGLHGPGTDGSVVALPATGEPLYRTDLTGRLLPEGSVEVLGDDRAQTSVHGHPLNLREVEAMLASHPAVLGSAVVPSGAGSVAYVKAVAGSGLTTHDLDAHLRARMSPFLVPERIELVGAFALTASGRTDRDLLTAAAVARAARPPAGPVPVHDTAAPADLVQRACALTAQVLGLAEVGENMNLLDLGASSIQLVRLATRAESELELEIDIEELFRFPSVAVLVSASRPATTASPGPGAAAPPDVLALPSGDLIIDPEERSRFVSSLPGRRVDLLVRPSAADVHAVDVGPLAPRHTLRRTCREFATDAVPSEAFTDLLAVLVAVEGDEPRHAYPSAGSLFPVQVYVTVSRGRVESTAAGAYYLDPVLRQLVALPEADELPVGAHAWINRAAYRASAFSVHLVADLAAIAPMYGVRARDYCLIEAGAMSQLIMSAAAEVGLGTCPVGDLDAAPLADLLQLGDRHELMHTLLGGVPAGDDGAVRRAREAAMLNRLARR